MHSHHHAWLDHVDPRSRVIAAVGFTLLAAVSARIPALLLALAAAAAVTPMAGLRPLAVFRRLGTLNLFMLVLLALMPWGVKGTPIFAIGPLAYTEEGLLRAVVVAIKGNAIVLAMMGLVGTLETSTLGHALLHMYVPDKLIHLLLFTVRYIDVLQREYHRMTAAMKARAFRPRMNLHTYRAYGHLFGMLLVRALDRSQRIVAAMKCRGFRGRFWLLDHFHFSRDDLRFAVLLLSVSAAIAWVQWR
jgi:cobalt/nickel transport system permease protein